MAKSRTSAGGIGKNPECINGFYGHESANYLVVTGKPNKIMTLAVSPGISFSIVLPMWHA
jgi:hypothetical protein